MKQRLRRMIQLLCIGQRSRSEKRKARRRAQVRAVVGLSQVAAAIPVASVDSLAVEVFKRLQDVSDQDAVLDAHVTIFEITTAVAAEWRARDERQVTAVLPLEAQELLQSRYRTLIQALPPSQRDVVVLHVTRSLNYRQIAEKLNLPASEILKELTRGYETLRQREIEAGMTRVS